LGERKLSPFLRNASRPPQGVGDGSKVENRDGSKVNWDNLKGKMAEDVGPYQIGRFLKDPDFGLRVIKDGYGLFKGWSNFVGSAFEFNGMINSDFSGRSQGEMQVEEG
jgi:hypothetical protein